MLLGKWGYLAMIVSSLLGLNDQKSFIGTSKLQKRIPVQIIYSHYV